MNEQNLLSIFHHIHHKDHSHEVHHCGGAHVAVDPEVDYTVEHCRHGKHRIDKETAVGHASDKNLELIRVVAKFHEKCDEGGWHLESGTIVS